jgi:hypothetical protein
LFNGPSACMHIVIASLEYPYQWKSSMYYITRGILDRLPS